jgi:2-polyprenyl-3-methyl-5-hydroxy-6-metoxy-1,4-benzoquinol methylase
MSDWVNELFIRRAGLFLPLLNQRWLRTKELTSGMTKLLKDHGIMSGNLLDLCCGNGRISIHMARKGFKTIGVDISKAFLEDAKRKAKEHRVSDLVTFLEGDVRKLKQIIRSNTEPFDVVVNTWTSVGYFAETDDLSIFKQARQLSRKDAILFIAETMHTEYLSIKFAPTSYAEIGNMVMLEDRKYDPITAQAKTSWIFYEKRGKNLEFIDQIDFENHVYSPSELAALLKKAGWETIAFYGSLSTQQPMSPLTSLNIVAKAT